MFERFKNLNEFASFSKNLRLFEQNNARNQNLNRGYYEDYP